MNYGLVGAIVDPAPRMLEALGFTLGGRSADEAVADLIAGQLAAVALSAPLAGHASCADTLTLESGALVARSTLAEGLLIALRRTGWGIADRPTPLLGTGARAEALGNALLLEGVQHLRFAARSMGRAIELVNRLK